VRQLKADYRGFRQRNAEMPFGANFRHNELSALAVSPQARVREYEDRWRQGGLPFMASFADLMFDAAANETAADFIRGKIRSIVKDPNVAEKLSPHHPVGCKRLCVDTDYYATFNRPNVTLVDGRGVRFTPWSTDPAELAEHSLHHQAHLTYDFAAAMRVALREYAPDVVLLPGPGGSLGAPTAQLIVREGYRGIRSRREFEAVQAGPAPVLLSMRR